MVEQAINLQPAYILQARHYRETSLIIDVITRDFGRISMLAKGARKPKSKTIGLLQPFVPLLVSCAGKTDLKILTAVECHQRYQPIGGMAYYCGFYLNELLVNFLAIDDPYPDIFTVYNDSLPMLADESRREAVLRVFELQLISAVGYGLPLTYDHRQQLVEEVKIIFFDPVNGPIENAQGLFSGETLIAMQRRVFTSPRQLCEAKKLMRAVIDFHLQGKRLKSRVVINQIIKQQ